MTKSEGIGNPRYSAASLHSALESVFPMAQGFPQTFSGPQGIFGYPTISYFPEREMYPYVQKFVKKIAEKKTKRKEANPAVS